MKRRVRRTGTVAAALAIALGCALTLSACDAKQDAGDGSAQNGGSQNDSSQNDKNGDGGSNAPKPETPKIIAFPGCSAMNTVAKAESDANTGGLTLTPPQGSIGVDRFNDVAGPAALATMAKAKQVGGCYYPVSMHNAVSQWVAEVPKADYQALVEVMRADSFYSQSTVSGVTVFSYTITEDTMIGQMTTHYAYGFIGDVWIAIIHNASGDYTQSGVDSVLAANPWLLTSSG